MTKYISCLNLSRYVISLIIILLTTPITAMNSKPIVVDYWPSWESDLHRQDLKNTSDVVDVINIAFAVPDGKGGIEWLGEKGKEETLAVIKHLQKKNKIILISVGGADVENWELDRIDINLFANNIKIFVDEYNLNGVDIDYELVKNRDKLTILIKALRNIMPKDKYIITYTGWAIGAYGIKGHKHEEWNHSSYKGIDIDVLKEVKEDIDWVNVMAYDIFDLNVFPIYDPRESALAFKDLMENRSDKVVLGIELGLQNWPKGISTSSKMVAPWLQFIKAENFKGVMIWTLNKDVRTKTGEPDGTFLKLIKSILKP